MGAERDSADLRFAEQLQAHGVAICEGCGRALDRYDVSWNNGSTEYGTGYCTVNIICAQCDRNIAQVHSWYPEIESFDDAVHVLDRDWI